MEVGGADLLTTLLGLLILGAAPIVDDEQVNQAPHKTQVIHSSVLTLHIIILIVVILVARLC